MQDSEFKGTSISLKCKIQSARFRRKCKVQSAKCKIQSSRCKILCSARFIVRLQGS